MNWLKRQVYRSFGIPLAKVTSSVLIVDKVENGRASGTIQFDIQCAPCGSEWDIEKAKNEFMKLLRERVPNYSFSIQSEEESK